ncbi:MAG: FtsW/RodA/SpoVE family cell cycle protein [Clostridia bacterium]|nr:FtsW/RodA/SpoVE family cell cycle protein [Clostridia bacterium]
MPSRNRNNRKKYGFYFDYSLLFVLVFVVGFGLTMIYSTSSYTAQIEEGDPEFYFRRQLIFTIIGFVIMVFETKFFDYHYLKKLAWVIYIAGLFSMLLLKTPLGITRNGATRWIRLPGLGQFQPAEVVKIGTIALTALLVVRAGQNIKSFKTVIVICIITGVIPAIAVYALSSNLSSALIVMLISVVMTFVAYPSYKIYVVLVGVFGAAFAVFLSWIKKMAATGNLTGKFRLNRILVWLNPEKYIDDKGYQTVQALYAIGSGGLFGKGLGKSLQKLGYIPESQNDMIFSVICEELGLFGAFCLIALFVVMLWRINHIAQNAPDLFGSMLATGVFAHIAIQVILNIAVVTNTIPNTGVSLPFISYGGSSAVLLLAELGIVFNISSQIKLER